MLIVFTFTLRDITKIYTVYKTPTWVCGRKWNISLSGIPKPLNQSLELRERRLRRGPLLFRKWGLVNIHGWAGTNQVLISIDVINPGNGWPEFVFWFHEGLQGTKEKSSGIFWEVSLSGEEETAMIFPRPEVPLAQQVLKKYKKLKSNLLHYCPSETPCPYSAEHTTEHLHLRIKWEKDCIWGHLSVGWW